MMDKKVESPLWGYIGKAGVLVALVWGGIQIYNYFFKTGDYEASVKGNHSFYETSPEHNEAYLKNTEYKSLVRTIIDREGALKEYDLDSLLKKIKASTKSDKSYFDLYLSKHGLSLSKIEFSSLWTFSIKNTGNRPLEELALELPFEGTYKVILPNNLVKSNTFSNKIEIGELRPSYEANVYCWTGHSETYSGDDEEKSRFTHKNGWFGIDYPVEVTGFYAWIKENDTLPLVIAITITVFLSRLFLSVVKALNTKKMPNKIVEESKRDVQEATKTKE